MIVPSPPQFAVTLREVGTTSEITVEGDLDISTVAELRAGLHDALQREPERVVVDLRPVTFIDSSGLRCLIEAKALAETSGLEVVVLRPLPPVDQTFEICGLDEVFPLLEPAAEPRFGASPAPSPAFVVDWS